MVHLVDELLRVFEAVNKMKLNRDLHNFELS